MARGRSLFRLGSHSLGGMLVLCAALVGPLLAPAETHAAPPSAELLIEQLEEGVDFRVRVQAALELGKSKNPRARAALEAALDDDNAAVRAACAAALKVFGDARSLPVLIKHKGDESAAVRAQIESTILALRASTTAEKAKKPELLVQIGKIRSNAPSRSGVEADVERASREKLADLPGIAVLEKGNDAPVQAGKKLPVVMVTGHVKHLSQKQENGAVIYSAAVEFVLHKMPGQTITGVVSGSAKASGSASQASDREAMDELRRSALEAAIESAIRRAPPALRAAVQ